MELHISLSKTFPVRYLHIESIRKNIQQELLSSMIKYRKKGILFKLKRVFFINRFTCRIENVTILTNEDGST